MHTSYMCTFNAETNDDDDDDDDDDEMLVCFLGVGVADTCPALLDVHVLYRLPCQS